MKKIILILALFSLGVSKAQVVGGYLPLNSTKSATMGGLKVSGNETVTGTFSVGSTATVNGAVQLNNNLTVNNVFSSAFIRCATTNTSQYIGGAIAIGKTSNPNTNVNLDVAGTMSVSSTATITGALKASSTMSLGSANLTGGNTGTVAVLSDVPLTVLNQALSTNPTDAIVYYMGTIPYTWQQLQGNGRYYLDANYTLTGATINFYTNGTLGSSETVTIAIGVDNSFTNISTALTMSAISTYTNITGLSQNINSGSYIETRITCPTWATNPTMVGFSIVYNLRRRS